MTPSERISVLETLLARIQRNAALGRGARLSEPAPAPARARPSAPPGAQAPGAGRYAFNAQASGPEKPLVAVAHRTAPPPPPLPRKTAPPPPAIEVDEREEILELDDLDVVFEEEEAALGEKARRAREAAEKAEKERLGREAFVKAERERLVREAAAKAEKERRVREAAEKANKAENERLAREAAEKTEKAENERLAREAAEKAEKAEKERLAREAAERAEKERLAREAAERAEKERLAREAAERAEKERLAREAIEKAEQERLAREAAEKAAADRAATEEEPAPVSSRQLKPKHEIPAEDEAFGDIEEEEAPPESGEVASQRKPSTIELDEAAVALADWEHAPSAIPELLILAEASPSAIVGSGAPPIEVTADITRRLPLRGEAAQFLGAARAPGPPTFGDLLDGALALGEE